jgi:hypothetical protein
MRRHWRNAIRSRGWAVAVLAAAACGSVKAQVLTASQRHPILEPIGVCELLKNITQYRDRIVAVRGIYWFGLRNSCSQPFVTGEHTWPSALNLVESDSPPTDATLSFRTNQKSWDALEAFVRQQARAGNRAEIWVTVVGKVRAPATYIRGKGRVVGGYGHLGVFPAELVVKDVSNVVLKSNPTYDYRELLRRHGRIEKHTDFFSVLGSQPIDRGLWCMHDL